MTNIKNILKDSNNEKLNYVLKKINHFLKIKHFKISEFCEFKEIDFNISPYDFSGREIEIAFIDMFNEDPNVEMHQFFIDDNIWKAFVRVYK